MRVGGGCDVDYEKITEIHYYPSVTHSKTIHSLRAPNHVEDEAFFCLVWYFVRKEASKPITVGTCTV